MTTATCAPRQAMTARRALERAVRRSVVAFARWRRSSDESLPTVAQRLMLAESTIRRWASEWSVRRLPAAARGRPVGVPSHQTREAVKEVLDRLGPGTSLASLKGLFPDEGRRSLARLLNDYRCNPDMTPCTTMLSLSWKPRMVWAMDFTEPDRKLEPGYTDIFCVRDLGSGCVLEALPVASPTAQTVADVLVALFLHHGPPLVIKSDNGGALRGQEVRHLLDQWGVLPLVSPGYYAPFNGACEAGIGALKVRIHHEAVRTGTPAVWACADVEAGRRVANAVARPRGASGMTPGETWAVAEAPTMQQRRALRDRFVVELRREIALWGKDNLRDFDRVCKATIRRIALSRALAACGILKQRRRRISPPLRPLKVAGI